MKGKRTINVEAVNSALALYEETCLNYYRTPCKEMFDRVVDVERICIGQNIRRSELTRIRLTCMHVAEEANEK